MQKEIIKGSRRNIHIHAPCNPYLAGGSAGRQSPPGGWSWHSPSRRWKRGEKHQAHRKLCPAQHGKGPPSRRTIGHLCSCHWDPPVSSIHPCPSLPRFSLLSAFQFSMDSHPYTLVGTDFLCPGPRFRNGCTEQAQSADSIPTELGAGMVL